MYIDIQYIQQTNARHFYIRSFRSVSCSTVQVTAGHRQRVVICDVLRLDDGVKDGSNGRDGEGRLLKTGLTSKM